MSWTKERKVRTYSLRGDVNDAQAQMRRAGARTVSLKKDGYKPATVTVYLPPRDWATTDKTLEKIP